MTPLPLLIFYAKGLLAFPTVFIAYDDKLCISVTEVDIIYGPPQTVAVLDPLHRTADKVRENGEQLETLLVAISP